MNTAAQRINGFVLVAALGVMTGPTVAQDDVDPTLGGRPIAGKSEYARRISARNAFGLVDPPKPPPVVEPPAPVPPPPPPSNIQLTGFSRFAGERKVYMVVTKPGARSPDYYDLREGDKRGDIEVLQIDDHNEFARITNMGVEQTLNFKDNGSKQVPGAVPVIGVPGTPNPGMIGQPVPPPPIPLPNRFANVGPTVVGRGGVVENVNNPNNFNNVGGTQPNQNFPNNPVPQQQFNSVNGVITPSTPSTPPELPSSMGQNPSIGRSRVFNIPPPPLPPQ